MRKRKILTGFVLVMVLFFMVTPVWGGAKNELKGTDITIGVWWEGLDVFADKPRDEAEERTYEYRKKIQRDNSFSIKEVHVDSWTNMQQKVILSIMSGSPAASVFVLEASWAKILQSRGLLFPVSDSNAVDFAPHKGDNSKVHWSQTVKEAFTHDGKAYAFGIGQGRETYPLLVWYNKRLFREAGLDPDLPYNMQRDGTWTWENFIDVCKKLTRDVNNDGIIDIYAMCEDSDQEMHNAIISSNGANYVEVDSKTGKFVNGITSPAFLEALNYARRLRDEGVLKPKPEPRNWDWYRFEFTEGRVAMNVEPEWIKWELGTMKDDFGVVFFPKGPRVSDYVSYTDELVFAIPNNFNLAQVNQILRGVELWYTPHDTNPNGWKDGMYRIYRDSRAIDETLTMIRNPKIEMYKYHLWVPGLNIGEIVWQNQVTDLSTSQLIESVTPSWNAIISDANDM